jgi:hypothetical protein
MQPHSPLSRSGCLTDWVQRIKLTVSSFHKWREQFYIVNPFPSLLYLTETEYKIYTQRINVPGSRFEHNTEKTIYHNNLKLHDLHLSTTTEREGEIRVQYTAYILTVAREKKRHTTMLKEAPAAYIIYHHHRAETMLRWWLFLRAHTRGGIK